MTSSKDFCIKPTLLNCYLFFAYRLRKFTPVKL
jgi:hypothetical protein